MMFSRVLKRVRGLAWGDGDAEENVGFLEALSILL
jgi:hypothetical protein